MRSWVAANIDRWQIELPNWYKIEMIPDELLPLDVYEAEGGMNRIHSVVSFRRDSSRVQYVVAPTYDKVTDVVSPKTGETNAVMETHTRTISEMWIALANEVFQTRSSNYKSNIIHINRLFEDNSELVSTMMGRCPLFRVILSYILEDRFGFRVKKVDWTSDMRNWGED